MPPRRKSDWKPIILRKISLVGLCLLTIGLIGLVQYAIHKLPHRLEVYNSPAMETASSPRTPVVRTHMLVRDTDVPGFTRTNVDFSISPPSTGNNILAVETASLLATPDETSYSTASEAYVPETVLTFHFATDSAFLVETPTFSTTSDEYFAGTPTAVTPPPLGSAAKSEYVAPTGYRNRTTTGTQPSRGDALDVNGRCSKVLTYQSCLRSCIACCGLSSIPTPVLSSLSSSSPRLKVRLPNTSSSASTRPSLTSRVHLLL